MRIRDKIMALLGDHQAHACKTAHPRCWTNNITDQFEFGGKPPLKTCDHGIGITAHNSNSSNHRCIRTNQSPCSSRCNATPPCPFQIGVHIITIARIIFRIDDLDLIAQRQGQTVPRTACFNHRRTTDKNGLCNPLLNRNQGGTQDTFIFAIGIDHALGLQFRLTENRLHHETGTEDKAVKTLVIFFPILNGECRNTRIHGSFRNRRRNS